MSISFCSFTLMMTRLGPSARRPGAREMSASAARAKRNMQRFLLEFRLLSRRKCGRCAFAAAQIQARHPLAEGGNRNVKEPDLEHRQERHRDPLVVLNREPEEVGKINGEGHFGQRQE